MLVFQLSVVSSDQRVGERLEQDGLSSSSLVDEIVEVLTVMVLLI